MRIINKIARGGLFCLFIPLAGNTTAVMLRKGSPAKTHSLQQAPHDGQHDFDFEIGTWKTHLKRLQHPLTGSTTWVEYDGTSTVRKVWNGKANVVELEADGTAGHIEAASLRLYDTESKQWTLNFASGGSGSLGQPCIGEFKNGRGEFYDQEAYKGRAILLKFVIIEVSQDACRFEQSFSDDGGKTWELNWLAIDTRVKSDKKTGDSPAVGMAGEKSPHLKSLL